MKKKIDGSKFYGLVNKEGTFLCWIKDDIEYPKEHMSKDMPHLVELTVTKVFIRNPELTLLDENK